MTFELLPAVDVADGQAVRLVQGRLGTETTYGAPLDAAPLFLVAMFVRLLSGRRSPLTFSYVLTKLGGVKVFLESKGYKFESETDTEVVAKLVDHLHTKHPNETFREIVEKTIQQLEGAFACAFKSRVFPAELVATRRGSPLLVGIRTEHGIETDSIPIQYK